MSRRERRARKEAIRFEVSEVDHCDRTGAHLLLEFARDELTALGPRPALKAASEALLWSAFAWNHGLDPDTSKMELLDSIRGRVPEVRIRMAARMLELRASKFSAYPADLRLGPLRVEPGALGILRLHLDFAVEEGDGRGDDR